MSSPQTQVVVVGGGVIGALCAWHLSQRGHPVTVVDRQRFGSACSHGNCGYVCPSHIAPLPAPGAISSTLKAMVRRNSPFSIRWRFSPALWQWLFRFALRCNRRDMREAAAARHALLQSSLELYQQLFLETGMDCEWETRGLLFVFQSARGFEHYAHTQRWLGDEFGVSAKAYDGNQLTQLEPALKPGLGGAWHYTGDCHLRPDKLMQGLRLALTARGVQFIEDFEIVGFRGEGRATAVRGADRDIEGAEFVVAAGALTPLLNRALGLSVPIQPGKGYSITMTRPESCPRIPMILEEHRVGVTPLRESYRIGSTMEFAGYDATINRRRLQLLYDGVQPYLHEPRGPRVEEEWFGWRPMTWDGKPIIDRCPKRPNVWIAAGHNMLGLSMAPATGKLIAEMIDGQTPHLDAAPFRAARF